MEQEGYGRYYYQDNVRFCYMARGSLEELLSHRVLAHQIGSIPSELFTQLAEQGNERVRLINGYIAYLKRSKQGANDPVLQARSGKIMQTCTWMTVI